ncbi:MAG: SHOCT domain-containing protein [Anaerolineae bacterium]|nr:SHOCT domain-containing protein [Anaerolineae bacterium]
MGGLIGLLFNLAVLVGIVLLVVWAVQKVGRSTNLGASRTAPSQLLSAREILDIRYARGELTREEYQTKLSDIS